MHVRLAALLLPCVLLSSCAYQGVVVDKTARDLPFGETVGVPSSFAFMLKDSAGVVHRQLVTPEVYARYEVGDVFNDAQPVPPHHQNGAGDKVMLTASRGNAQLNGSFASTGRSNSLVNVAAQTPVRTHKRHHAKTLAKRSHHKHKHSATVKAKSAPVPEFRTQPADVDIVEIGGPKSQ